MKSIGIKIIKDRLEQSIDSLAKFKAAALTDPIGQAMFWNNFGKANAYADTLFNLDVITEEEYKVYLKRIDDEYRPA